ncbi:MAG: hypothetical protein QY308_13055 [Ignavibacteriaceae bacterium]|nr:MAG: hypothetical protein QY308_13055 [Ignavibacteriaceae bacterium]
MFSAHWISVTAGFPSVIVPVLSKIIESIFFASSKLSASFINIPCSAPLPIPTIIAVGVANPKAQGHAITSTVTIASNPCVNSLVPPITTHAASESRAIIITVGTKMADILSTNCCTGARLPCAS